MDLPMLRLEHYFSYMIHPSQQIFHPQQKFYMDVLCKEQFFQDHPNMCQYTPDLAETHPTSGKTERKL